MPGEIDKNPPRILVVDDETAIRRFLLQSCLQYRSVVLFNTITAAGFRQGENGEKTFWCRWFTR